MLHVHLLSVAARTSPASCETLRVDRKREWLEWLIHLLLLSHTHINELHTHINELHTHTLLCTETRTSLVDLAEYFRIGLV